MPGEGQHVSTAARDEDCDIPLTELGDPVGQPADDVDRDDGEDQLGHLPVGLPLALRSLLPTRPHGPQFYNDFREWNNYVSFKLC